MLKKWYVMIETITAGGGFSSLGKYQRGEEDVISDFNTNPVFLKIPYLRGKGPYPPVSTSLVNTTLAK